jgi:hypothetical protein
MSQQIIVQLFLAQLYRASVWGNACLHQESIHATLRSKEVPLKRSIVWHSTNAPLDAM